MIAPALWFKRIADLLDKNSTHRDIAYAQLTAQHSCDYIGYVRHVGRSVRNSNKSNVIPPSSHSTKSGINAYMLIKFIHSIHIIIIIIICNIIIIIIILIITIIIIIFKTNTSYNI